jgi:hypothetical protein
MEHKEGCWFPRAVAEEARYAEAWPNHCRTCDGWGGFSFYESDTGYSGVDPCANCLEQGKCPRCAGGIISEAYWDAGHFANCDNCGYVEGTTQGGHYINEPCACIEEQMYNFDDVPF